MVRYSWILILTKEFFKCFICCLSVEILHKLYNAYVCILCFHGVDSLLLKVEQVGKISLTLNVVLRRIYQITKFSSLLLAYT